MRKVFVQLSKIAVFCLLFVFLFQRIALVVQIYGTEQDEPDRRNSLFFSMPRDTVDVLMLGTSHVYCSFIPKQIYEESGITSASLATSSQSYQNSYWLLKETLKRQKPEVVILDIHPIATYSNEEEEKARLHLTSGISIMPDLSINKYLAFRDISNVGYGFSVDMSIYDAYGFLEYKNEYDRVDGNIWEVINVFINPISEHKTLGFYATDTIFPLEEIHPYVIDIEQRDIYDTVGFEYLNKIFDLLQENDIELLLTRAPYDADRECESAYVQAFEWAEENDIPIIDYFELIDEIEINLATDFKDRDHLNYLGAKKATAYLTNYLVENYDLTDHRGDKKYWVWEEVEFDYGEVENTIKECL